MVCMDVGANVGFVGLHMARAVGPTGKVYAFEPVPFLFEKLRQNIRRNRLEAIVESRRCAISNRSERALMTVPDESVCNQGLALLVAPVTDAPTNNMEIECTSLDDFADRERLDRLNFIKIDVQGAEALVIEGARSCLARFGPDIVMELSSGLSPLGRNSQDTIRLVEDAGYAVFELTAGGIGRQLRSKTVSPDFSALNVVCKKHRGNEATVSAPSGKRF
jgi:FkbM family methyltransferase